MIGITGLSCEMLQNLARARRRVGYGAGPLSGLVGQPPDVQNTLGRHFPGGSNYGQRGDRRSWAILKGRNQAIIIKRRKRAIKSLSPALAWAIPQPICSGLKWQHFPRRRSRSKRRKCFRLGVLVTVHVAHSLNVCWWPIHELVTLGSLSLY